MPSGYQPGMEQYGGVGRETSEQIQDLYEGANRPAEDYAADMTGGPSITPEVLGVNEPQSLQSPGTDVLSSAIERRASRGFGMDMAQMKRQIQQKALEMRFQRLQNVGRLVSAEHQQNYKARMNKYIAEMNRRRARASTIGNILGIAGAAGGAAVGGPGGAMAGYQIGQGAGQMSGGGF